MRRLCSPRVYFPSIIFTIPYNVCTYAFRSRGGLWRLFCHRSTNGSALCAGANGVHADARRGGGRNLFDRHRPSLRGLHRADDHRERVFGGVLCSAHLLGHRDGAAPIARVRKSHSDNVSQWKPLAAVRIRCVCCRSACRSASLLVTECSVPFTFRCRVDELPTDLNVAVVASYTAHSGEPRCTRCNFTLPFSLVCEPIPPVKSAKYKITLESNCAPPSLPALFEDVFAKSPAIAEQVRQCSGCNIQGRFPLRHISFSFRAVSHCPTPSLTP